MKSRISKRLVTFQNAFVLDGVEGELPAGDYTIETLEESPDQTELPAIQSSTTTLIVRPPRGKRGVTLYHIIDPVDLEAALAQDAQAIQRTENAGVSPLGSPQSN